ncbi:MAG: YibE/F family protein [Acidimicrobiia bacterium]
MNEHSERRPITDVRRWLIWIVVAVAALALVGLVALWPRGDAPDLGRLPNTFVDATVTAVTEDQCVSGEADALTSCQLATVQITSGPDRGQSGEFLVRAIDFSVPRIESGDRVVLLDVPTSPPPYRYSFSDFQRSTPMWGLVALFVVVVIGLGRWQGVRALLGLVVSAAVLVGFVVPSILRDEPAILVAITGTIVVAFAALYLAHGVSMTTTVALTGTLASLAVTTGLALVAVSLTHLTGLADEEAQILRVTADALDVRGLLIAGIVVGALGVLDDVTVTQVSTVSALHRAQPDLGRWDLYREATSVGRDHVASTVNTLVLAYAGAALPLLVLFEQGSKPLGRILTSEVIAVEIVRMLVGSIGLVLSVPITTALAAAVVGPDTPLEDAHGHAHGESPSPHDAPPAAAPARPAASWDDFARPDDWLW